MEAGAGNCWVVEMQFQWWYFQGIHWWTEIHKILWQIFSPELKWHCILRISTLASKLWAERWEKSSKQFLEEILGWMTWWLCCKQKGMYVSISIQLTGKTTKGKQKREETHFSIMNLRNGSDFSIPSMLASDWTNVIGIMKKKVRKKNATATISLLMVSERYGIARLFQYTSRGSGAQSVSHMVGFLDCWVCAQTAAAHLVLNETNATGIMYFGSFVIFKFSAHIWHQLLPPIEIWAEQNRTEECKQVHNAQKLLTSFETLLISEE